MTGGEGSTGATPWVAIHGPVQAIPAVDITFDLGALFSVSDIVIGHASRGCCGMVPPNEVSVSYSSTGPTSGYGASTLFPLWGFPNTLAAGHYEMTVATTSDSAQWVKLSFPGGDLLGGNNKYVFDEITINGTDAIPEPGTASLLLIGLGVVVAARRRHRRK